MGPGRALVSRELSATALAHRHDRREEGLSDHAALVAEVAWRDATEGG